MTKESFLRGAVILALASTISRVIGLTYMVVLPRLISDTGMGLYQLVKPIHYFAAVVAIAGMPVAISKLIAEKVALGSIGEIRRVFRLGLLMVLVTGGLVCLVLVVGAGWLAQVFASDLGVRQIIITLGPACLFLALSAAFRGFFQGLQYMTPTAVSQVVDQIIRVGVTITLALWFRPRGIEQAVAAVGWGFAVGELIGWLILVGFYFIKKRELLDDVKQSPREAPKEGTWLIIARLVTLAAPAVIATVLWPIMQMADSMLIPLRMEVAGFGQGVIRESLGHLGMALTLSQFPNIITVALATSLVPAVSEAWALRNRKLVAHRAEEALRMALIFGIPSCAALQILAIPLGEILFGYGEVGHSLRILATGTISLGLIQASTGVLQGFGAMAIPVRHLIVGVVLKFTLNYYLVANPSLGILGAALSTALTWSLVAVLNLAAVFKRAGSVIKWRKGLVIPLFASVLMALAIYYLRDTLVIFFPNVVASLVALVFGLVFYFLLISMWGTLEMRDFHLIPVVGKGLGRLLQDWGFLRS